MLKIDYKNIKNIESEAILDIIKTMIDFTPSRSAAKRRIMLDEKIGEE